MVKMDEKTNEILEYIQPYMQKACYISCNAVKAVIETQGNRLWKELQNIMDVLFRKAVIQQKEGKKGYIKYLVFSFLWQYIDRERLVWRIEALDDGFYLDEMELAVFFCPEFLQERFESDLCMLYQETEKKFLRLQSYEKEGVRREYAEYYFWIFYRLLESMTNLIIKEVRNSDIIRTDQFKMIYGRYMDKAIIIYSDKTC